MKKNPTHNKEISALKQEITSLRDGLQKTAGKLAECMVELEDTRKVLRNSNDEVARLNMELIKQGQYQTRAHETIELLVKKMPHAQDTTVSYAAENKGLVFHETLNAMMRDRDQRLNRMKK